MNKNEKKALLPALRFPGFRDKGNWEKRELRKLVTIINEKTGNNKFTPMSISSGLGLVSQIEKFGREIAGSQYKNYFVIRKFNFAYNKSATKQYPEGYIAMYSGKEPAAVPNSIFICFKVIDDNVSPQYLNYLFLGNLHGKWIKKYIMVGARAHGSLNIDNEDLLSLPVPLPLGEWSHNEQQKIADCLTSIDDTITTQTQKLDALIAHKNGLMQQLFPAEGETAPKLRFPEFRDKGEWKSELFKDIYSFQTTNSLSRDKLDYKRGTVKNIHYGDIHTKFSTLFDIEKEVVPYIDSTVSTEKMKPESFCIEGDMIFADASEDTDDIGKCIEIVSLNNEKLVSGMHTLLARQKKKKLIIGFSGYLFNSNRIREQIKKEAQGTKVFGISARHLLSVELTYPPDEKEQEKITDCLTSIDKLITAQTQKLDALRAHKKGLMQQLFPAMDEVDE